MQLWFSRTSEISLREQLATQIVLGILSGELRPGDRLPSIRELARRFRLHPNTVSAGYRQLQGGNWVELRKGSGVYIAAEKPSSMTPGIELDQLITDFFQSARRLNAPLNAVRERLRHFLELQPPDHFLLIEPDAQLANIIVGEMQKVVKFSVRTCQPRDYKVLADGAAAVAISISTKTVRAVLPASAELQILQLRSARESLARHLPQTRDALVGIASGWAPFLKNARTMLIAAGFAAESLVVRDATKPGWLRGLEEAAAIVCDSFTATRLNGMRRVLSFPLLAESSLEELQRYERLIKSRLAN